MTAESERRFVPCPVCDQVAEIQDRLRSEAGAPITHVTLACVAGHWTMLPSAGVPVGAAATEPNGEELPRR
jgi:hypothetical protein